MAHPQSPQRQPTPNETADYTKTIHNASLALVVVCPLVALLPPRKLDFFTLGLAGTTLYSANYLIAERSGRSIYQHLSYRRTANQAPRPTTSRPDDESVGAVVDAELRHLKEESRRGAVHEGLAERITEETKRKGGWVQERAAEETDALDVGKGYGDIIMDQIWEVVNWGKPKEDD